MLYVLNVEIYDSDGAMPAECLLYEDSMNLGIDKLFSHTSLLDQLCDLYKIKVLLVQGTVNCANTTSNMIIPVVIRTEETDSSKIIASTDLAMLLSQPETAVQAILKTRSEAEDTLLETLYENYNSVRKIKRSTKVMLREEYFLDPDLAAAMITNRPTYRILPEKNVDLFQNSPTDTICIALPSVEEVQQTPECINTLNVLYLTAPYRLKTKVSNGYMGIFHTPFFRTVRESDKVYSQSALQGVDAKFRWLYGVAKNNMLPIQSNEQQLYDNMYMLYCEDVTNNMERILSGIFYQSKIGRQLQKLENTNKSDFISALQMFLADLDDTVKCDVNMEDAFNLDDNTIITKQVLIDFFDGRIHVNQEGVFKLMDEFNVSSHIIDCTGFRIPAVFENIDDGTVVQQLITRGFISGHMYDFFIEMCMIAYRINWGHSATTQSIPGLSSSDKLDEFDNRMITRLNEMASGKAFHRDIFETASFDSYDSDGEDDEDDDDDISIGFRQYLSNVTITKIKNSPDGMRIISDASLLQALTPKEKLVERWRVVNGEARLSGFINKGFILYNDPKLLILAFIKLLRWGEERKPTMLVFPEYPEIKTVYDLNESVEIQNIYLVSEKDLILKDGCRYTLVAALYSQEELINTKEPIIVGFLLSEDYGKIQKYYVASWNDMATLVGDGKCDISNLKLSYGDIGSLFVEKATIDTDLADLDYEFFVAEDKIAASVSMNCRASQLSDCALLVNKGIAKSGEFIKSAQRTTILSVKDKQYDILHRYISKLSALYGEQAAKLKQFSEGNVVVTDLLNIIDFWKTIGTGNTKPMHNEVVGSATLQKLSLTETPKDSYAYAAFEGLTNVAFIVDADMSSGITPLKFTDKTISAISAAMQNKIVFCMGYKIIDGMEYRVFFRREDLTVQELQLKTNEATGKKSPVIYKYANVSQVVNKLKSIGFVETPKFVYCCDKTLKGCI